MRAVFIAFLFLFFNALYVSSTPLPFNLDLPANSKPEDVDRLNEAHRIANLQINAMDKVLQNPTQKKNKKILRQTFGKMFDYNAIRKHVDDLKAGTVKVSDAHSASMPKGVRAKTSQSGTHLATVRFGPDYHDATKMSDNGRAGTLIHEASHALFGTKDYFSKEGTKISHSEHEKNPGLVGYMGADDYHTLKGNGFSRMHENADSWKAFGYHALNGKPHPFLNKKFKPAPVASGQSPQRATSRGRSKSPVAGSSKGKSSSAPPRARGRSPPRAASHGRSKSTPASPSRLRKHGSQSSSRGSPHGALHRHRRSFTTSSSYGRGL